AGLFACIVGVISSIAVGFDPSGRMYKQKTDELIEYMRWKQLDNRMQEKVLNYFKLKYRGKYFQESSLLNEMNESLRMEIAAHNCRELISKVPFLRREQHDGRDDLFSGRIACALEPCYFVAGDVLFVQGEVGHDMSAARASRCCATGRSLEVTAARNANSAPRISAVRATLIRNRPSPNTTKKQQQQQTTTTTTTTTTQPEIALIANIPRTATVRATSNSMIYRLTREAFMSITEVFDDVRVHVDQLFKERMDKIKMDEELKKMSVMQSVLAKLPFLGCVDEGLEDAFCAKLVDLLVSVFFVGGDIITSEGEESSKMYILKSGSVDIRVKGQTTEVISSGGYFGEFALITKSPWKSTAQATSACMCYTIERTAFHAFLQEFPKTKEQLLGSGRGLINGES
ncbi:anaphase-promoting complex subunit Hcn1, partial [Entophlyctis luteolus]